MDGIMLARVVQELRPALTGGKVTRVSQPDRDLLLLAFRHEGQNLRLLLSASPDRARLHLTREEYANPLQPPMFCMLLRKHLQGAALEEIAQPEGDRAVIFTFSGRTELGDETRLRLHFEAMGRYTNLILEKGGVIVDAIRHVTGDMSRVRQILPGLPFESAPLQPGRLDPAAASEEEILRALSTCSGTLGKGISQVFRGVAADTAREFALRVSGRENAMAQEAPEEWASRLKEFFGKMLSLPGPSLLRGEDGLPLALYPFRFLSVPGEQQIFQDTCAAMDAFYTGRDKRLRMEQKNASLRRLIRNALDKDERKLLLQEEELGQGAHMEEWRTAGELLIAQAYRVPKGAREAELQDYFSPEGGMRRVALDPALTAAQNAQKYFKRYRKARSAMTLAAEQKDKTLREIALLEQALTDLDQCEDEPDLEEVREFLREAGLLRRQQGRKAPRPRPSRPRVYLSPEGRRILVGKNSMQNERITREAAGEDLWLHAKDIPGSHVVIQGYREGDAAALEQALLLAAFYSSGKGEKVPVDYTLRKHVKKPGGSPAGFVRYTNQKTVTVTAPPGRILEMREE